MAAGCETYGNVVVMFQIPAALVPITVWITGLSDHSNISRHPDYLPVLISYLMSVIMSSISVVMSEDARLRSFNQNRLTFVFPGGFFISFPYMFGYILPAPVQNCFLFYGALKIINDVILHFTYVTENLFLEDYPWEKRLNSRLRKIFQFVNIVIILGAFGNFVNNFIISLLNGYVMLSMGCVLMISVEVLGLYSYRQCLKTLVQIVPAVPKPDSRSLCLGVYTVGVHLTWVSLLYMFFRHVFPFLIPYMISTEDAV